MIIQVGVLCKWTDDSQRFLLEHFDTIHDSPSHIYHSALPSCPSSSWLHEYYRAELSQEVKVVKGLPAGWGPCSRTVLLDSYILDLSCWNNTIAVASRDKDIIILDAITGTKTAALSGHTYQVSCVTFSPDGKLLVSGSYDDTAKLWDMQTGGVIKSFSGHTSYVLSVSISPDLTTIASGSLDSTIRLWSSQSGDCYCAIKQQSPVRHISFYPTGPQHLLSISGGTVWQWDIDGHEVGPRYNGSHAAFSSDGAQFAIYDKMAVTVRNTSSRVVMATFHIATGEARYCCFSPDGRLVAVAADKTAYVWDITSSEPHCIETFGHTSTIRSLAFSSPSFLVSTSYDESVYFWQIGIPSDPAKVDPKSASLTSAEIISIILQAKDGIAITNHSDGVVRVWDISTGLCKSYFQTPVKDFRMRDAQLISGKLIFAWSIGEKINIWDSEKGEILWTVDEPDSIQDFKISGDGSRVFFLDIHVVQALSIQTGEIMAEVKIKNLRDAGSLTVDGSRVWVHQFCSRYQGWDFGIPGASPVQLSDMPTPCLADILMCNYYTPGIMDRVTEKMVFKPPRRFGKLGFAQLDGHYLAAHFHSTELLILDFNHVLLQ